ncbi:tRNA dihydrouridine(20/20a) synthase DusA [Colwellia sp. 1_MG-2023]|uniref:tRNA dihydrouridine(20/20a) synthase DusA n=1 Tax=unclassified Colwellia TaxID=196834 RepID=UPI001C07F0C2|nr:MULTISPECIES: tRNA dihydrouridine(20/20a) synthase DusA [unclassified Colwellia]MBU2924067.1 tRNA dihydrouridine(20/20a) synthase DusA [Colwellia sp. C2M11]MDO6651957.1 tRNA dihydrouridine(20/20a) synthase DusA [Colwellia sp. 3_MG-2023]MDO6664733.1 tRNA dihydrouridine(20/20a) synthase DusA [Colwellia sp. 2_MG-2023]MDO6689225.1 tRNA dihydrouridine(20/20a) synthase DusA [Colwellia sp. 1_MG-2023]
MLDHKLSVAPMLDWTDRHCRYFYRVLSAHTVLYTEMVTTGAILHGRGDYLSYNEAEHPLVLQLGGSNVKDMTECAKIAEQYGYDEININVGCPSDRVQNGRFGACLMAEPTLVGDCVNEMQNATNIPVTVKSRIGIDDLDSYEFLHTFIDEVAKADCNHFIIHARKAWLTGLSPKQNRDVPPLDYERVYQIKRDFSNLNISINGGIKSLTETQEHLQHVDGVMIGREIYSSPYLLSEVDQQIYGVDKPLISREQVINAMADYIDAYISITPEHGSNRAWHVLRHMLGMCNGLAGARQFRRDLSDCSSNSNANGDSLKQAFAKVVLPE